MKKTADAVVIGGGIAGASTFYYLARMGLRNTVLLEKGDLASGSTGDSAAMVRQHYSNEVSIRLVKESLRFFLEFPEEFDGTSVYNSTGWLFLCEPDARQAFDDNMAQLQRLGVRTWEISAEDAAEELPGLNTDGIGPVAFEPDSGYADPNATVRALVRKGEALGAEVHTHTAATGLVVEKGCVSGRCATASGTISTPIVVNAVGAVGQGTRQMGRPRSAAGAVAGAGRGHQAPWEYAAPAPRSVEHGRPHLLPPGGRWHAAGRRRPSQGERACRP